MIDGDEIPVIMEMDDGRQFSQSVVSETGTDPKVTALVNVAVQAPDATADVVALSGRFPTMPARHL